MFKKHYFFTFDVYGKNFVRIDTGWRIFSIWRWKAPQKGVRDIVSMIEENYNSDEYVHVSSLKRV